ncbi:MAG: hypothetical protein ABIQ77_00290 [Anaerolineales bacterium]
MTEQIERRPLLSGLLIPFLVTAIVLLLAVIPIWLKFKLPKVVEKANVTSDESAVVTTA